MVIEAHTCNSDFESVAQDLVARISKHLPKVVSQLLHGEPNFQHEQLQFECTLSKSGANGVPRRLKVASLDIGSSSAAIPEPGVRQDGESAASSSLVRPCSDSSTAQRRTLALLSPVLSPDEETSRPKKMRKANGGCIVSGSPVQDSTASIAARRPGSDARVIPQQTGRLSDNPALHPSTLNKLISGVWETIYSGVKLDPAEVIEQWQAIESDGRPKLLMEADNEIAVRNDCAMQNTFGRMNILTKKISQTSRTCRSLEVIVQAHWVQCFDDRVADLTTSVPREKAKKTAISEACVDFNWSEKELRNRMGIWRGYHDVKNDGGWAVLVFAGTGLYRFCKYRMSFTDESSQTLRNLRHRFEVAADTLHPRWRQLLGVIGGSTERKYTGHPHNWVVGGPTNEAIPLPETYRQWDATFSYAHMDESVIDEEAWGLFDPRVVFPITSPLASKCQVCGEHQDDDPVQNACSCFPNIYGSVRAGFVPVQVYRTPNGKNNGLLACCPFENGAAVGEFVGQITSGLSNLDVMVGQTERASYQIWQGKAGNHLRFVNHSCQPNSQYERFMWLGTERVVLVSRGIEAGEEITVDYSDTYWKNLDKECLCGESKCRYRRRNLLTSPGPT